MAILPLLRQRRPNAEPDIRHKILTSLDVREPEKAVTTSLISMFNASVDHPVLQDWRRNASRAYEYREGKQWTDTELADLAERGQPASVRNEIHPRVNRILGQVLATKIDTTYLARNSPADEPNANQLQDLDRYSDQQTDYEFHEEEVLKDGITGGIGVLDMGIRINELGQRELLQQFDNPFDYYWDPFSLKMDWSDAKYIHRAKWMDEQDAIAKWPDKAPRIRRLFVDVERGDVDRFAGISRAVQNEWVGRFIDLRRRRVRPVETYWKRVVRMMRVATPDGITTLTVPLTVKDVDKVTAVLPADSFLVEDMFLEVMWWSVWAMDILLHHDRPEWKHNFFPWVPFFADRKKNGEPFGPVSVMMPIQDSINKRESKAINLLSNRRTIYEKNAIQDPEDFAIENARSDGMMEVEEGALRDNKVQLQNNVEMGAGHITLMQGDMTAMDRASGLAGESMGLPTGQVRSGTGVQRLQQAATLVQTPLMQNVRRYRKQRAKVKLAFIQEIYDEDIAFQVTDDPNAPRIVQIRRSDFEKIRERTYDVVITEQPDYTTVREQQQDMLFTLIPQVAAIPGGFAWVKLAIQMSNLRDKQGLLSIVDEIGRQRPELPKMSLSMTWHELTPEEKAMVALLVWNNPQFAQALVQTGVDPAFLEKIKAEIAQTELREGTRAMMERGKLDLNAMQVTMAGLIDKNKVGQKTTPGASGNA